MLCTKPTLTIIDRAEKTGSIHIRPLLKLMTGHFKAKSYLRRDRRSLVRVQSASVRGSTLLNLNISETSRWIIIKFHLEHHWSGGLAASGYGSDKIRTLVSMATDSSHRVVMGKIL